MGHRRLMFDLGIVMKWIEGVCHQVCLQRGLLRDDYQESKKMDCYAHH